MGGRQGCPRAPSGSAAVRGRFASAVCSQGDDDARGAAEVAQSGRCSRTAPRRGVRRRGHRRGGVVDVVDGEHDAMRASVLGGGFWPGAGRPGVVPVRLSLLAVGVRIIAISLRTRLGPPKGLRPACLQAPCRFGEERDSASGRRRRWRRCPSANRCLRNKTAASRRSSVPEPAARASDEIRASSPGAGASDDGERGGRVGETAGRVRDLVWRGARAVT